VKTARDELQAVISTLSEKRLASEVEMEGVKATGQELEATITRFSREKLALETEIKEVKTAREELQAAVARLQADDEVALQRADDSERRWQEIRDTVPTEVTHLRREIQKLLAALEKHAKCQEFTTELAVAREKIKALQAYQDDIEQALANNFLRDLQDSAIVIGDYYQRFTSQYDILNNRRNKMAVEDPGLHKRIANLKKAGERLGKVFDKLESEYLFVERLLSRSKNKPSARRQGREPLTIPSTPTSAGLDFVSDEIDAPIPQVGAVSQNDVYGSSVGATLVTYLNSFAMFVLLIAILAEGRKFGQWKSANAVTRGLYVEQHDYVCTSIPDLVFLADWILSVLHISV
jgi:uncharacterized coiled-coil DUF342 family protein